MLQFREFLKMQYFSLKQYSSMSQTWIFLYSYFYYLYYISQTSLALSCVYKNRLV